MMMVKNVFGEYVPMNEEDVENLIKTNKKLVGENMKLVKSLRTLKDVLLEHGYIEIKGIKIREDE